MTYWTRDTVANWKAAALLGLVSSSFSTLISQFIAGRIGRDALVDWTIVAAIPFRDAALTSEPQGWNILAGILFHQWADFSWEITFFGLLGFLTARLKPWTILLIAVPWAVFTSAAEWFFLVPIIPFWQAAFPLEQTYWIGFLVHATSASMYPLFPLIRDWVTKERPGPDRWFSRAWAGLSLIGLVIAGGLGLAGTLGHEVPHFGQNVAFDQRFIADMRAHHVQGIALATLASKRAEDPHLRALARLMVATQQGDIGVFDNWWRSWFGGMRQMPEQHAVTMPGMLSEAELAELDAAQGPAFDPLFITLMSKHHRGAIAMSDEAVATGGDPRIRIMAHALRHQQLGEIQLMQGTAGPAAVAAATTAMLMGDPDAP